MSWLLINEFYIFGGVTLAGTIIAAIALCRVLLHPRMRNWAGSIRGIEPPMIGVMGMLFGLAFAFLANDTWTAHDHAVAAVNREANALRGIVVLAKQLPATEQGEVRAATADYIRAAVTEWPMIARRQTSPVAAGAADHLLEVVASPRIVSAGSPEVARAGMEMALAIREGRTVRATLSHTQINPFKWLVMAFLGFVTMSTIGLVHVAAPKAMLIAVTLFTLSTAPPAAIVLVHGNPFEQPLAVSPEPIAAALDALNEDTKHS